VIDGEVVSDRQHLALLTASWGLVADFCFGDLLLVTPIDGRNSVDPDTFVVVGQIRPTTSQTLYEEDLLGHRVIDSDRPQFGDAWRSGTATHGQSFVLRGLTGARIDVVPVRRRDGDRLRTIALLSRETPLDGARRLGRLERVYLEIFDRLAEMISAGSFPFSSDDNDHGDVPRVGDGVLVLGPDHLITYASPNAVSAMHRLGHSVNLEGRRLRDLVTDAHADAAMRLHRPVISEVAAVDRAREQRAIVIFRTIPLLAATTVAEDGPAKTDAVGAVVLVRDVSDLRRRDQLIATKDASIREVHHRVKNNLQTISSLLRLQGRRLESAEAKEAIEESVRRIRSIALVHETLSRDVRDAVPFDDIVRPLMRMVEEGLASPERPLRFVLDGTIGDLPPETATPLAVVLTELLQNAVEHAYPQNAQPVFPNTSPRPGEIRVHLANDPDGLTVEVSDDGVGLPDGFSLSLSTSLGLSIVRTLVTTELGGVISFRSERGTIVTLKIPRVADPRAR
jgi:two-component system, sensor histidine kinase PdtaS